MNCVLIVEDDSDINNFINDYFVIKGYSTIQAFSGTEGLLRLKNERDICCVILDLMLPGLSGEEIIQEVRKVSDVPIITVSAKNEEEAKIEVLKLGADDFLLKPFNLEELQLKVERNIQKYLNQQVSYKKNEEFKNIILNQDTREVFVDGRNVYFTSKEFDILMLLIQNPNKVISKEKIFKEVWHEDYCIDTQTVTVHIKNIRKKIKEINPTTPTIETVWGIGFKDMLILYIMIVLLSILLLFLGVHLLFLKKEIRHINLQFLKIMKQSTNAHITKEYIDKDTIQLIQTINQFIDQTRQIEMKSKESNEVLKSTILNMSHDLRTPLTSIQGYLQLINMEEIDAKKRKEYIKIIEARIDSLKI